jgi:RND family efflux transporter MFP subunit
MKRKRVIWPILIILLAIGLTVALVKMRSVPKPLEAVYRGPLVDVLSVAKTSRSVVVQGTGTVQARQDVAITPQVPGRVAAISPDLVVGGQIAAGELLFAIEDVDYQLAIALARGSLAQADLELQRIENLAKLARQEWQALNPDSTEDPDPLVVYEPQLANARAQRDAARARLKQAEINLERTRVVAPFNGYVRSEQVEIGQYLSIGTPVATIVGTDTAEVLVPLPLDELVWIDVPDRDAVTAGSPAEVELVAGGEVFRWHGAITRAHGEIDPDNRMAQVVVTIDDTAAGPNNRSRLLNRLLPGMFVRVSLQGETVADVLAIPRGAVRDHDTVWLADAEDKLRIRSVDVLRRDRNEVLIRSGLNDGDRIVLTNLSGAADGMQLRPQIAEGRQ